MLHREAMESREVRELSPFAMHSADSKGRAYPQDEHPNRTAYQRDRERIIHCTAFRRLQYKTQVFVNHEGDHYRTRLTHTMEVAQIARAIARILNVNEDLAEAIALAHDLGHTPFGHSGEDALRELMKDYGGFEHNIHGLRVVDVLERPYPNHPGLNLTWEVRESIAKHTTTYDHPTVHEFDPPLHMVLEGQIVEAADSIAYVSHDLDDALGAGLLDEKVYEEVDLLHALGDRPDGSAAIPDERLRRNAVIRALINLLVTDLCRSTLARIEAWNIRSENDVRHAADNVVCLSDDIQRMKDDLQSYLYAHVYRHYRVARMANKARRFVQELFTAYVEDPAQLPPDYQTWVKETGPHQAICDYVAGMTDRYAQDEYKKLFVPYERV